MIRRRTQDQRLQERRQIIKAIEYALNIMDIAESAGRVYDGILHKDHRRVLERIKRTADKTSLEVFR
jgi:hypothetical protein